jgi:hypothetical protein
MDQRNQTKSLSIQDSSSINGDNQNTIKWKASRYFRNKRRKYQKYRINELAMNSKNKNNKDLCRGINQFKLSTNLEVSWGRMRMVFCLQIPTIF